MGLYVHRIVIDANVINARGGIPEMTELESYFRLGVVELVQTSVLPIEFEKFQIGKEKAANYGVIHGSSWPQHTVAGWGQGRKSNFTTIYETLWGKMWKKKGTELDRNSLRDAIHLDVCWINKADFFLTKEKAILLKRDELYSKGFDTKVLSPEECLSVLKEDFRKDFGTDNIPEISKRISQAYPVLLASNACKMALINDPKSTETLFATRWMGRELHIEANLYDAAGNALVRIFPNKDPEILADSVAVHIQNTGPRVFYFIDPNHPEPKPEQYLRLANTATSQITVTNGDEIELAAHIVPSGHVLIQGRFFNKFGHLVALAEKKRLQFNGFSFEGCQGGVFPSGAINFQS